MSDYKYTNLPISDNDQTGYVIMNSAKAVLVTSALMLNVTYADISTSQSESHPVYGTTQAKWQEIALTNDIIEQPSFSSSKKGSVRTIKSSSSVPVQNTESEYDIWS